ncbi:MAG: hypothetical protein JXA13_09820 [Anaerolineales bacterium]|nr:hypothetical protein [Anaerolineales bacterium]
MDNHDGKNLESSIWRTLLLAGLAVVFMAGGCSGGLPGLAAPTETPTQTAAPSPTLTPTATQTPTITPSPTPTPVQIMVDGREVAVQGITVDNAENLERLTQLETGQGVNDLLFLPDGETLAVVKRNGTVQLWDTLAGSLITEYSMMIGIKDIRYEDDKFLMVACNDFDCQASNGMKIISLQKGTGEIETVESFMGKAIFGFSPDGKVIVGKLIDTMRRKTDEENTTFLWHNSGQIESTVMVDRLFELQVWKISEDTRMMEETLGEYLVVSGLPLPIFVFSPDGTRYLINGIFSHDGSIQVTSDKTVIMLGDKVLEGHTGLVSDFVFSPDDTLLATAAGDRTVILWRVEDGALLHILDGHLLGFASAAFSPTGTLLASCSINDRGVSIWGVR